LKRQQFDYRNELSHTENLFDMLQSELHGLDERIAAAHAAEEEFLHTQRQNEYQAVKETRYVQSKRELSLGYLQNNVRGLEMDFQRLHRIMGVKFTPEKPDSVQDIVKASLNHEQRNASLLHYVSVQNAQVEELDEQVRALDAEEERLSEEETVLVHSDISTAAAAERAERLHADTMEGIEKRATDLTKLCPIVERICQVSGAAALVHSADGDSLLTLQGCRPDTLTDYLRVTDSAIRNLRLRAEALPTATGNEWLRDFLRPSEVLAHVAVTEVRKELEASAQKQKEAKEARSSVDADVAALPITVVGSEDAHTEVG